MRCRSPTQHPIAAWTLDELDRLADLGSIRSNDVWNLIGIVVGF